MLSAHGMCREFSLNSFAYFPGAADTSGLASGPRGNQASPRTGHSWQTPREATVRAIEAERD